MFILFVIPFPRNPVSCIQIAQSVCTTMIHFPTGVAYVCSLCDAGGVWNNTTIQKANYKCNGNADSNQLHPSADSRIVRLS